ncbi:MAG: energy-coupling factor ABC transporter ATP-binding protein [Anaerolineales bacterium]|nr:energy-coupling factor ABC transporter ATP-binding protein [Anaerolineales bacterium]
MIRVNHLSIRYNNALVLNDISMHVKAGECILITGPSGCGKSTLAFAVSGLIPQSIPAQMKGNVQVNGLDTSQHPLPDLARHVGMVFQNPSQQLFHLHVEDEVAFGPRNLGYEETEVQARVEWALNATGLTHLRHSNPVELSGGQKQCVAIASVLAMKPKALVLDEPTASLDVPNTRLVMNALHHLLECYAVTIVLIEHRLDESSHLANRVILMDEGRIVADGLPSDIFSNKETRLRLGLRRPIDQPLETWTDLIQENGDNANGRSPLLELREISAGYNHHAVIEGVNLSVYPNDFIALVGNNGAGKTTLALAAAGLIKPQKGNVCFLNGKRPRAGQDVSLLFQNPVDQLFCDSVEEEVGFGMKNYRSFDQNILQTTLEQADLSNLRTRRPTNLSVGQQQRTALAACLALHPKLVILDEPTLGQDWGHLSRLMDYLVGLNQNGTAIILISHDYKLVHRYARRIVLMENGNIKLAGYLPKNESLQVSDGAD